jgi:hypothetical protein
MTVNRESYPVRVDASLDPALSRGWWLVKWLLLIPHVVVLTFLWLAFTVFSVVAFVAILVVGRYPRPLFDFNVGVLRWTWRVHYYGYGALGTDRYPPFTLADDPDFPAHLEIPYPRTLSRGLVLVKWWLLAIPQYLVLAVFLGGGIWLTTGWWADGSGRHDWWAFGGLIGLLVTVAGVMLLFTGRYPAPLFDFVLGMDRWVLRVAAYVALMTDAYPPFRLDMGGTDPGSPPSGRPATAPPVPAGAQDATAAEPRGAGTGWTAGRVVSAVLGALLLLTGTGLVIAGGGLLWADRSQRDDAGYVWAPAVTLSTEEQALTSQAMLLEGNGLDWVVDDLLGDARIEVTPVNPDDRLFVGVGRTADVDAYLLRVGHDTIGPLGQRRDGVPTVAATVVGGPPPMPPGEAEFWVAKAGGTGPQVVDWRPSEGEWTVVVMRTDGGTGLTADARAGATLPGLAWLSAIVLGLGILVAAAGTLFLALAIPRPHRDPGADLGPAEGTPPRMAGPTGGGSVMDLPAARP